MSNEKMREEFEVSYANLIGGLPADFIKLQRLSNGSYDIPKISIAWFWWQASREALVIELPQQSGANLDWNQAIRYCHQAIEAAGVKVAP